MKKYSELSYDLQCKICKNQLRPMAAQIFGHIYQAEAAKDNGYGIINAVGQARELLTEVNKQIK